MSSENLGNVALGATKCSWNFCCFISNFLSTAPKCTKMYYVHVLSKVKTSTGCPRMIEHSTKSCKELNGNSGVLTMSHITNTITKVFFNHFYVSNNSRTPCINNIYQYQQNIYRFVPVITLQWNPENVRVFFYNIPNTAQIYTKSYAAHLHIKIPTRCQIHRHWLPFMSVIVVQMILTEVYICVL